MGLSVNNNTAAYNTYRNLTTTQGQMAKSLEKLSSGYRINRAADDAAGLAISEGLRSQIQGLTQATRNSQDAINVVQTAEGALSESTSILQRMRTLAVQASSTGSINDDAKANIQSEVVQLKSELDRIASTTKFNGKALLDGSFSNVFQVGANSGETISVAVGTAMDSTGLGVSGVDMTGIGAYAAATGGSAAGTVVVSTAASASTAAVVTFYQASTALDFAAATSGSTYSVEAFRGLKGSVSLGGKTFDLGSVSYADGDTASQALTKLNSAAKSALGLSADPFAVAATDTSLTFTAPAAAATSSAADIAKATPVFTAGSGASDAITKLDAAIKSVSNTRANLGAVQNRLEHTIANLGTATENLTASESSIRDVDMASEMVKFTSKQILSQAGTAMLAQAKSLPQSVLSLLQN